MIAGFQILWHWYISSSLIAAQTLLRIYLSHKMPHGGAVYGYLDLFLPTMVAGLLTGWIGWQWPARKIFWYAFFAGTGLAILMVTYPLFFSRELVWWWPQLASEPASFLIEETIKSWVFMGFFTYAGYVLAVGHYEGRAP